MNRIWVALFLVFAATHAHAAETSVPVPAMTDIKGGMFTMGSAQEEGFAFGHPKHEVRIKDFRIGTYEVTFEEYDAFTKDTGAKLPDDMGWGRGRFPVINVNWQEMQAYIAWLNAKTGRKFRLPTEAEWEYAARGNTSTAFFWGDNMDTRYTNSSLDTGPDTYPYSSPVGSFLPNAFGLYDVLGNAYEAVADCYHPDFVGAPTDGSAWISDACDARVMRGGSWTGFRRGMRSTVHSALREKFRSMALGLRLAEDR